MTKAVSGEEKNVGIHPILLRHNVFIVWRPEYNTGIPIIDEQHRGIVSAINSLYFGMQNNYVEDMLIPIVDMMYDYTHIHFQIEEDFLEKIKFPDAKAHHALHHELSFKLTGIGRRSILNKDPYQVLNFLKEWWINHICSEDMVFKKTLSSLTDA